MRKSPFPKQNMHIGSKHTQTLVFIPLFVSYNFHSNHFLQETCCRHLELNLETIAETQMAHCFPVNMWLKKYSDCCTLKS